MRRGCAALLAIVAIAAPAAAEDALSPLDAWSISGTNTARADHYEIGGNEAARPYPYEGLHPYNELSLSFSRQESPYDRWRGEFLGLVNNSKYRSTNDGAVIERFNLTRERGDVSLPHRYEIGDTFGYFSFRTLQRTLKGGKIDFQPTSTIAGGRQSLQLLSGFVAGGYTDADPRDDYFNGVSWLIDSPAWGKVAVNGVHNYRQADYGTNRSGAHQAVASVAAEHGFELGSHRMLAEGEFAGFFGDSLIGTTFRENESELGYFAKLSGRAATLPLTYSARAEYYGRDFRPNGAVITPNRRSWDFRANWRFDSGRRLSGRVQRFTSSVEDATALDNHVVGVTLAGPVAIDILPGLNHRADLLVERTRREDRAVDTLTSSAKLDLDAPLGGGWLGRAGLLFRIADDDTTSIETTTYETRLSGDRAIRFDEFRGVFSPGLVLRRVTGTGSQRIEFGPRIAATLAHDAHRLNASYELLARNNHDVGTSDLVTHNLGVSYQYRLGRQRFGADVAYRGRDPDTIDGTHAFKFGVFWSIDFVRPARAASGPAALDIAAQDVALGSAFDLAAIAPGSRLTEAEDRVRAAGFAGGAYLPGLVIYEAPVIEIITERQRLALEHERGMVRSTTLIIDVDDDAMAGEFAQLYERAREYLFGRYGTPVRTMEEGAFEADMSAALTAGRFVRSAEWDTPAGVIRLGIPRRLDHVARIEIRYANDLPSSRGGLWSLDIVR
jgi:hypothetical protein